MSARPSLREWLSEAPFTLAMSSGFFGFYAHAGALRVLEDEGLVPARLAGSSAGALVTGLWAGGVDATEIERELMTLERAHFWDPSLGPGLLRGRLFRAKVESLLRVPTFEGARRPLTVSVFDLASRRTKVVDRGELAPAIHASCALPVLFHPVRVDGRLSSDGGIADRPGLAGVASNGRVLYHHLASKSPWRRARDPALRLPRRDGLTSLVLDGLPRVNPFRLDAGRRACALAATGMRDALSRPIDEAVVRVDVAR